MVKFPEKDIELSLNDSTTPEEVLLQIALAFMVFLGFLLSEQSHSQAALDRKLDRALEAYDSLTNSGAPSLVQQIADVTVEIEKLKLLREWDFLKQTNLFFKRVAYFAPSDSPWPAKAEEIFANPFFHELHSEIGRLFMPKNLGGGDEYSSECQKYFLLAVQNAGFVPSRTDPNIPEWLKNSPHWKAMEQLERSQQFRLKITSPDSQKALLDSIERDLQSGRRAVADLQSELAARMLEAEAESTLSSSADPREIQKQYLRKLNERWALLPEVLQMAAPEKTEESIRIKSRK